MNRISEDVRMQIVEDREMRGLTLGQLLKKYGRSKSTMANIIKGCDSSKVLRSAPGRRVVEQIVAKERPGLSKTDIGEAARQMICARLMFGGVKVFKPMTEDTPIDLLVLKKDGSVVKCQCKYIYPVARGCHEFLFCSVRKGGANKKAVRHSYSKEEVDFFLGYCADNDSVYVLPHSVADGRNSLRIWILRDPIGDAERTDVEKYRGNFELLK